MPNHETDSLPQKKLLISLLTSLQLPGMDSATCVLPFSRAGNLILIGANADTTSGNFILDTGAQGLVLNITYFRDYPATTFANEEQSGITGTIGQVIRTRIGELTYGCIKERSVSADLVDLSHLENAKGVRILGLIGLSLLRQFEMIIDYEKNLLYLHRIGKREANVYKSAQLLNTTAYHVVPIEIWNNYLVTRTTLGGKKLRLMIDSGSESNLLDSRLPDKVFDNVEILRRVQLYGTGTKNVEALYANLSNLMIGNQNTGTLPVIIANLDKTCLSDNSCIDGILGFDFLSLHKIGFNFVTNKMYIWK